MPHSRSFKVVAFLAGIALGILGWRFLPPVLSPVPGAPNVPAKAPARVGGGPGDPSRSTGNHISQTTSLSDLWTVKSYSEAWKLRYSDLIKSNPTAALNLLRQRYGTVPPREFLVELIQATGQTMWGNMLDGGMTFAAFMDALVQSGITPNLEFVARLSEDQMSLEDALRLTKACGKDSLSSTAAVSLLAKKIDLLNDFGPFNERVADFGQLSPAETALLLNHLESPFLKSVVSNAIHETSRELSGSITNYRGLAGAAERVQYVRNFLALESRKKENPIAVLKASALIDDPAIREVAITEALHLAASRGGFAPLATVLSDPSLLADPQFINGAVEIALAASGDFGGKQWIKMVRQAVQEIPEARDLIKANPALAAKLK